ncbi:MAG: GAF domain-containing protein, partial [Saprospiraceae bacterium]|nr:GAF domain-containing protein [Saprospiraceae bacterium]
EDSLTGYVNSSPEVYWMILRVLPFLQLSPGGFGPQWASNWRLLDQSFDQEEWMKVLPVDQFLFRGLSLVSLVDVTIEESTNRLQYLLLSKDDDDESRWMRSVRHEMCNLFRQPQLRLGIATLQRNGRLNETSGRPLWNSLLIREMEGDLGTLLSDSPYEQVLETGQTLIIEDLAETPDQSGFNRKLLDLGIRNYLLTPLHQDGKMIGLLEMASRVPRAVHGLTLFKINRIKPIFADAVRRHADEFESRAKAAMLEQFTAIHPAIQWKFREAAIQVLEGSDSADAGEQIVFDNLYPFYGSLDIRNSSRIRNQAISWDLQDNLGEAQTFLNKAYDVSELIILRQLSLQVDRLLTELAANPAGADEQAVAQFIRERINPVV